MTDQKTEQKIDFFELEVAEEEEKPPNLTAKWNDPDLYAALARGRQKVDYNVSYTVSVKDLADFPVEAMDHAQTELARRVMRGIEVMEQHIIENGLLDCIPVVYSRPDWENLGLARYSVGVGRNTDVNRVADSSIANSAFQRWIDSPDLRALAMCTPGRNPLTGGE